MATYGKPYRLDRQWVVQETGADGITVSMFLNGPDDDSAGQSIKYDSKCSWCYLGAAHSLNAHNERLTEEVRDSFPTLPRNSVASWGTQHPGYH